MFQDAMAADSRTFKRSVKDCIKHNIVIDFKNNSNLIEDIDPRWKPPEWDWVKCNFDACLVMQGYWGLWFIFRNDKGEILVVGTKKMKGSEYHNLT